jgi:hypothetical protein
MGLRDSDGTSGRRLTIRGMACGSIKGVCV